MSSREKPVTAVSLALEGGMLMLISGVILYMWFILGGWSIGRIMGGLGGMMESHQSMMGSFGLPFGFMSGLSLVGLVAGILVLIGAILFNARPTEHNAWGTIILVFSTISLLGMGGFVIGALLGIIGGAFTLSWKPRLGK